jgi:signal transduction histidine kinase
MLRFDVRDTGIGIAPADQERIFQDFAQVDGPIQRRVRGTGLGLPLTRKLAALLGGRVEVVSAPGTGSTFTAIVPAVLPDEPTAPDGEAS